MALPWVFYSRKDVRGLCPLAIFLLVLDCWFGSGSPTARQFVRRSVDPPSRGRLPAPDAALPAVPDLFFGASLPPRRRPSVGPTNTHQPTDDMARVAGAKGAARARALSHTRWAHRAAQAAPQQQQQQGAAAPWVGGLAGSRADGAEGATGVRPRGRPRRRRVPYRLTQKRLNGAGGAAAPTLSGCGGPPNAYVGWRSKPQ